MLHLVTYIRTDMCTEFAIIQFWPDDHIVTPALFFADAFLWHYHCHYHFQTVIKEMNRLGMIVDLSHSSVQVTSCQKKIFPLLIKNLPPFPRQPVTRWRSLLLLWFSPIPLLKLCATLHETYLTNSSSSRYCLPPVILWCLPFARRQPRRAWWWSTSSPTS